MKIDFQKYVLLLFVGIVPILLFISPLFLVGINSFVIEGIFTFENYFNFFFSKMYMKSLQNSIFIATTTTIMIAPIGLLIVISTHKYKRVKKIVKLLTSLPLVFSSYVFCISLIYIYGRAGIINYIFSIIGMKFSISNILYSITGIIFANILFFLPYFIVPMFSSFEEINPYLEEVAESLGSYGFHKFRRVIFPQILHSFISGILLTFLLVFNQISVILALGAGRTYTLTYQLFAQYEGYQYNMANTIAMVSVAVTFFITFIFQFILKKVGRRA